MPNKMIVNKIENSDGDSVSFNKYVIRGILATNKFGITQVNGLESIKSTFFTTDEYPLIERYIREKNIEAIKAYNEKRDDKAEYLDIMVFKDQYAAEYIVTVYDSNSLDQDPQVIDIYSL
ncbi:hypothetical protein JMG10_13385 [Nostoc ellipsosporum NOK]|nr:hypothetical protein [Nostoc ellipsosporum NOK]